MKPQKKKDDSLSFLFLADAILQCFFLPFIFKSSRQIYRQVTSILFLISSLLSIAQAQQHFENPIILKDAQVGEVRDALVDNNGFLWIAGSGGLNRYDGHQHKYFRHDPKDSLSLFSNDIHDLFLDKQQNELWITTRHVDKSGLSVLDLTTEQIKNIQLDSDGSVGLGGKNIHWICKDRFGDYWLSIANQGLVKYLPVQDSIIPIRYQALTKETTLDVTDTHKIVSYSFNAFNDSLMWFGTREGLLKFNVKTHQFIRYPFSERLIGGNTVRCLLHHSDNQVYIGTWSNGLYRFDPKEEQFTKIEIDTFLYTPASYISDIRGLAAKSSSHLWVTTNAGLMEYDLQKDKTTLIKQNDYAKKVYHGVYQLDQKNRALFWISNSLYLFDPLRQQNKVYSRAIKKQENTKGFIVRRILEDETTGKLWIAAQYSEGLYRLDLKTEEWEVFPPPKSYFNKWEDVGIWDVLKTKEGEILVLLSGYGIYMVSEQEKKLVRWDLQVDIKGTVNRRMTEDSKGNIWLAGDFQGVFKIDPKTKIIRQFKNEFHHADSLGVGWVKDLKEDRNGNIWICTNAYAVYDVDRDSMYAFPFFIPDKKTYYETYSLGIDAAGNILIGSQDKGIGITDANHPEKGIVSYLDKSNGLQSNGAFRLLLDHDDNVWSIRGGGLSKISPDRSSIEYFNSNYFSTSQLWSMASLANGNIVLGDRKGISIFNPDSLCINEELVQPYVLSFKVFDEKRKLVSSPFQSTDIHLKPNENFFSLEISGLNPTFFGNTQFLYQLEGIDPDWVDPKKRRYIAYTNIPGGSYNFKLKAENNEGIWNETPYILRIHVATPWYRSWLAYCSYLSLLSGLLFYGYRFRLNQRLEREQALQLQELDTFKTRFYSNITHEFRTPLTVIEGMANELKNKPGNESEKKLNLIKKNSKNLLALVNQMLDLSKMQVNKIEPNLNQADVISFLRYLTESHESFAKLQNIGLQFYSEENDLVMDFDSEKLERILTNLLSNSIKFTPEYGKVLVVAKKIKHERKEYLQIRVKDNGIGISKEQVPHIFDRFHRANPIHEQQGTGIGLALVKELVNIMQGQIEVKSELNKGTTFFLNFPIHNKAPFASDVEDYDALVRPIPSEEKLHEPILSENGLPILLIIEDNTDVAYYLQCCLKDQYQIIISYDGKAGIEKAFEILPDVIISDVMMPQSDGFELCTTLKEDERTSHIPIILLTAKATSEDKLDGLGRGADAYLIKPFEKEELMARLDQLMKVRKTLQFKYSKLHINNLPESAPLSKEDSFIAKVEKIILKNIEDEDFSVNELARALHLSRSQVHRKIKTITNMSTSIYIRQIRLQKAKEILQFSELSISEVAYQTGFKSPVYFSQIFKETFEESPSDTRK